MLSSSSEYIKALREGKYLLFLGWTDFITQKYALSDADQIGNFLIFEWLNNGYAEEDVKKLAVLFAVYDLESRPIRGKLDFSLQAITGALFICMVLLKLGVDVPMPPQKKIMQDTVYQLVEEKLTKLNSFIYEEQLETMQTQFYQWVENADAKEVSNVFQKINDITRPRYLLEDYILNLERIKIKDDELYTTRLSMAKSFRGYLYEQTELTAEVAEVIAKYVNSLRELHPSKGEVENLDSISPPSTLDQTWRWVTGIGTRFFSTVLSEKSIGELISGSNENLKL